MQTIEDGQPFNLTTSKQKQAGELVIKSLRRGQTNRSEIVNKITEDVYDRKATSKAFLKNMVKSSNHSVISANRFHLALGQKKEVSI
jgi:hypothetical protein